MCDEITHRRARDPENKRLEKEEIRLAHEAGPGKGPDSFFMFVFVDRALSSEKGTSEEITFVSSLFPFPSLVSHVGVLFCHALSLFFTSHNNTAWRTGVRHRARIPSEEPFAGSPTGHAAHDDDESDDARGEDVVMSKVKSPSSSATRRTPVKSPSVEAQADSSFCQLCILCSKFTDVLL